MQPLPLSSVFSSIFDSLRRVPDFFPLLLFFRKNVFLTGCQKKLIWQGKGELVFLHTPFSRFLFYHTFSEFQQQISIFLQIFHEKCNDHSASS
jgi:hypothetical protein